MVIKSPITKSTNVILEKEIHSSYIIKKYKKEFNINVESYFHSAKKVSIYRCLDTDYRFYYPLNLAGKASFYQKLAKLPWYYMDWKWEHEIAKKLINKSDRVLEIGCGPGSFLKGISKVASSVVGLEPTTDTTTKTKDSGITILGDTIEEYSLKHKGSFDVVCSFQVLEHIPDVQDFFSASLATLKPKGKMIVSVPNNESFMLENFDLTLNLPPHHMGKWNLDAFLKIQKYFNLRVEGVYLEPLQSYHVGFVYKLLNSNKNILTKTILNHYLPQVLEPLRQYIIGHTLMVVYSKL